MELDYVKKGYSERRNLEAGDSEVVIECYQRIQGCLQRLTVSHIHAVSVVLESLP